MLSLPSLPISVLQLVFRLLQLVGRRVRSPLRLQQLLPSSVPGYLLVLQH